MGEGTKVHESKSLWKNPTVAWAPRLLKVFISRSHHGTFWSWSLNLLQLFLAVLLAVASFVIGGFYLTSADGHHYVKMVPPFLIADGVSYILVAIVQILKWRRKENSRCFWIILLCCHCFFHILCTALVYILKFQKPNPEDVIHLTVDETSYQTHSDLLNRALILVTCGVGYIIFACLCQWAIRAQEKSPRDGSFEQEGKELILIDVKT